MRNKLKIKRKIAKYKRQTKKLNSLPSEIEYQRIVKSVAAVDNQIIDNKSMDDDKSEGDIDDDNDDDCVILSVSYEVRMGKNFGGKIFLYRCYRLMPDGRRKISNCFITLSTITGIIIHDWRPCWERRRAAWLNNTSSNNRLSETGEKMSILFWRRFSFPFFDMYLIM